MKIGELAALAGCETETIRFYEKQGLLAAPARTASGYRTYQQRHLEDLQFIRHCRAFDMSPSLVRQLLKFRVDPSQPCGQVNTLIDEQLGHLDTQLTQLHQLKADLQALREPCQNDHQVKDCEILKNLVHPCTSDCVQHR